MTEATNESRINQMVKERERKMRQIHSKEIERKLDNKVRAVQVSYMRSPMENVSMPLDGYKKTKIEHPLQKAMVGWDR